MKVTKINIGSQFGGVISEADYENRRKMFDEGIEVTTEPTNNIKAVIEKIETIRNLLQDSQFKEYEVIKNKIKADYLKDILLKVKYREKNRKKYPGVTSILNWYKKWDMPEYEISQYASRGTLAHSLIEHFIDKQIWLELKELVEKNPELQPDAAMMYRGNLKLSLEELSYKTFFEKYWKDFEVIDVEKVVFNEEYLYSGRIDLIGNYKGEKSIIDWKTGSSYDMRQLAAYAHADEIKDIKQLVICKVGKTDNKGGVMKPVVEKNIKQYWEAFKKERAKFKEQFGI